LDKGLRPFAVGGKKKKKKKTLPNPSREGGRG
jgi:hypothetical protein